MNRCLCEEMLKRESHCAYLTLTRNEARCWYDSGTVAVSSSVMVELNAGRVIVVDVKKKEILKVSDENVKDIKSRQVLDLNDDGERWEGDVLNDEPYGWGVFYDKEGEKAYEGFRNGEVNVCYGIQYYSDIQKVEYEGEWCNGKRWGKGTQYDRNGNTVFDGEWMNDKIMETRVVITNKNPEYLLHNHVEHFIVCCNCCNEETWKRLDLSFLSNLRELVVSHHCFQKVEEVELIGLSRLERVAIGERSFTEYNHDNDYDYSFGHFYLKDCERLTELKIGCDSFPNYSVCEIENVDCLEVIRMGRINEESNNFLYASLELKSKSQRKK